MKTISKALIAVMVAAAMCLVPLFAIADDSDAITKTNGSAGISVEVSTSDETEIAKFFPAANHNDMAQYLWASEFNALMGYYGAFTISQGKLVSVEKYEVSMGREITDDSISDVDATKQIMKMTFKATCNANDYPFINTSLGELIKYMGEPANKTHKESEMEVTVVWETTESTITKNYIVKNDDDNYIVTKSEVKNTDYSRISADVKYTYGTTEKEFSFESVRDIVSNYTTEPDFLGVEPKSAKAATPVLIKAGIDEYKNVTKTTVKCDGNTYVNEMDAGRILVSDELSSWSTIGARGLIYDTNQSVPTYKFYGETTDPYALFDEDSVADTSLRSNNALKEYFSNNGSIGEDFGAAESVANSMMSSGSGGNNLLLYIAIGVGVIVVIAIVAVIILKKK